MQFDYELGSQFMNSIIPKALGNYLGLKVDDGEEDDLLGEEFDDDEEEESLEEEDDDWIVCVY